MSKERKSDANKHDFIIRDALFDICRFISNLWPIHREQLHNKNKTVWAVSFLFLVVQLAVATGAVLVSSHLVRANPSYSAWHVAPLVVALSQGALLGCWVAFSGRLQSARLLIVTCLVAGSASVLSEHSLFDRLSFGYTIQPLTTSAVFLMMQYVGLCIDRVNAEAPSHTRTRQFSLMQLVIWLSVVAAMLAVLRLSPEMVQLFGHGKRDPIILAEVGLFAFLAPLALWVALGSQRTSVRCAVFTTAILASFAVYGLLAAWRAPLSWLLGLFVGYPSLLVVWLLWFRAFGYRIRFDHSISPTVDAP